MISNFNKRSRKDDIKLLSLILFAFLFTVWLCTPPGNKIAQLCFFGNNTQFFMSKLTKPSNELNEWVFHRNNAIYLTQMERKTASLREMDKSVMTIPTYLSDKELYNLYADRGQLKLYWGEYKTALDDYLRIKNPGMLDMFKIALLYKEIGNHKAALSYCNGILNIDTRAYIGYVCVADVYASVGRYDASVRVYDLLIDRVPNRAKYYLDRAEYRKKCGDMEGYKEDLEKANELSPFADKGSSIIQDTLKPKRLPLSVI